MFSTSFASSPIAVCKLAKFVFVYLLCPSKKYIFGLSSTVTSNIAFVKASSVLSIVAFVESYVTKSYVSTILSFPLDAKRITESFDVKLYLLSKSGLAEISSICSTFICSFKFAY